MRRPFPLMFLFGMALMHCAGAQPLPPGAPAVVITEILYDMPGLADSLEFIELTNPSDTNERSLAFHFFSEGIDFTFPANVLLGPSESVIVARDSAAFQRNFGISAFQWNSGELDDQGELIVLRNNFNSPIDSVDYRSASPWPEGGTNGRSIVLCDVSWPNLGPEHWQAAATSTGVLEYW